MAVRASKAQYEHAFSEQHFFMNSVNSTDKIVIHGKHTVKKLTVRAPKEIISFITAPSK